MSQQTELFALGSSDPGAAVRRITVPDPILPLGPTATALQLRRHHRPPAQPAPGTPAAADAASLPADLFNEAPLRVNSEDGALSITLRATPHGLCMERIQRRPLGTHLHQSLLFEDGPGFERWCEVDPMRFDHPVLFEQLLRHGQAYFSR